MANINSFFSSAIASIQNIFVLPFIQSAQSVLTSISNQASNAISGLQNNITSQITNFTNALTAYEANATNFVQGLTQNLTNQLNSTAANAQNCSSNFTSQIRTLSETYGTGVASCLNQSNSIIDYSNKFIENIRNNTQVAVQNEINKLQNCISSTGISNPFDFTAQINAISCIQKIITEINSYGQTIGSQISNLAIQYGVNLQSLYLNIQNCISNCTQNAASQAQQLNVLIQQCLNN